MTLVYTHRRADWLQNEPWLSGSPRFPGWPLITRFVIHWPGSDNAIDGDPGEFADQLDNYLRNIQHNYTTTRDYNIGYNVAFDWLGGTWELRGEQYKCAANKGLNDFTFAGLILTDLDGAITPQCIASVQRFNEQIVAENRTITVMGHGEGPRLYPHLNPTSTQCPGPLQRLVNDGTFATPWTAPIPAPQPPPPIISSYSVVAGDGWFLISRKIGVDTGRLLQANPPATLATVLRPGQILKVPEPRYRYVAPAGGSLWAAATALRLPQSEQTYNNLRVQLDYKYGRVVLFPKDVLTA